MVDLGHPGMRQGNTTPNAGRSEVFPLDQSIDRHRSIQPIDRTGNVSQFIEQAFLARGGRKHFDRLGFEDT